ncbi:MAG: hypothetical protein H6Q53_2305 [Deltaproteobacteria bacterium]|nr:hypothetical protein [Deltaproteobacteria bacterium]
MEHDQRFGRWRTIIQVINFHLTRVKDFFLWHITPIALITTIKISVPFHERENQILRDLFAICSLLLSLSL